MRKFSQISGVVRATPSLDRILLARVSEIYHVRLCYYYSRGLQNAKEIMTFNQTILFLPASVSAWNPEYQDRSLHSDNSMALQSFHTLLLDLAGITQVTVSPIAFHMAQVYDLCVADIPWSETASTGGSSVSIIVFRTRSLSRFSERLTLNVCKACLLPPAHNLIIQKPTSIDYRFHFDHVKLRFPVKCIQPVDFLLNISSVNCQHSPSCKAI